MNNNTALVWMKRAGKASRTQQMVRVWGSLLVLTPWLSFPFLWQCLCLWPFLCLRLRLSQGPCLSPCPPCPWPPWPWPPWPWPPLPQSPSVIRHKSALSDGALEEKRGKLWGKRKTSKRQNFTFLSRHFQSPVPARRENTEVKKKISQWKWSSEFKIQNYDASITKFLGKVGKK